MNVLNKIWNEDCVGEGVGLSRIEDKSVDMILCDLPYGTTACKWDTVIHFDKLWAQYERVIKDNGAIVLTASQPFTSALVMSNPKSFRYELIWEKEQGSNHMDANKKPLKSHENTLVFYKRLPTYNPQKTFNGKGWKSGSGSGLSHISDKSFLNNEGKVSSDLTRYPKSVLRFNKETGLHPTQKPVALFEYLIKTYTNEGDLVLDNCAGSFTTAIACENLNRNWICMEQDREYCKIGWKRIQENRIRLESLNQKSA